jgi:hypothetical protein
MMRLLTASCFLVVLGLCFGLVVSPAAATTAQPRLVPASVKLGWLQVAPDQSHTVYVEGTYRQCDAVDSTTGCTDEWIRRSVDGGVTWAFVDLRSGRDTGCFHRTSPFLFAPDGQHLYTDVGETCAGPGQSSVSLLRSNDGGVHVAALGPSLGYGGGYEAPVISPADPTHLYALSYEGNGGGISVVASTDQGVSWRDMDDPRSPSYRDLAFTLVADPVRPDTIYANLLDTDGPVAVMRSNDMGHIWTPVSLPTDTSDLRHFEVSLDPHLPGLLVGRSSDPGIPADRRYLSSDGGNSWTRATCPGDLQGSCPLFTVDGAFGSGYSYAFVHNGIYRFRGGGPALSRVPVGSRLPLAISQIAYVGAGNRPEDPIFLLGKGDTQSSLGVIYRSIDQGRTWQKVPMDVLPTAAPSTTPGSLLIPLTHHSVAVPFVATYRTLGAFLLGPPVTEAYLEGDVLTQDFQHMQLEVRHDKVVIGRLGTAVLAAHRQSADESGNTYDGGAGHAIPNTPTQRYFPQTRHTLRGDMLRFWQRHGGISVLGAPITEVFQAENGDGSGRVYSMQYFENARLERHPELHNPRYAILMGLLGNEDVQSQGWLVPMD